MRGPSQELPPRISEKINTSNLGDLKDLKPELKNPLTNHHNLMHSKINEKILTNSEFGNKGNLQKKLNEEKILNEQKPKPEKNLDNPSYIRAQNNPQPPPPDPAEVFRENLELALSGNDLGSADDDPKLWQYVPNHTGQPTKETVREIDDEMLSSRIVDLRREVGKLDNANKPENAAQTLMLNSMLGIYVDEAEKRGIDVASLIPSGYNTSPSSTHVSDLFKPTEKDALRPATGLEDVSVKDLERRRANLEKSGLDQQTIEFLTRSIDQELEFRKSQ